MADTVRKEFTGGRFDILGPDQEIPKTGWAIRNDGAVFENGLQVGKDGSFKLGSTAGSGLPRNYSHIEYSPIAD